MTFGMVAFGAGCVAVGGIATGYAQKVLDSRREIKNAGLVEVLVRQRIGRYDSILTLIAQMNELSHSMNYVLERPYFAGDHYTERAGQICTSMRELARKNAGLLPEELIQSVTDFTTTTRLILDRRAQAGDAAEEADLEVYNMGERTGELAAYFHSARERLTQQLEIAKRATVE